MLNNHYLLRPNAYEFGVHTPILCPFIIFIVKTGYCRSTLSLYDTYTYREIDYKEDKKV